MLWSKTTYLLLKLFAEFLKLRKELCVDVPQLVKVVVFDATEKVFLCDLVTKLIRLPDIVQPFSFFQSFLEKVLILYQGEQIDGVENLLHAAVEVTLLIR